MSVDILIFSNTYDQFKFSVEDDKIKIDVNGQSNYIDRNQAYLLKLWLEEHLK